MDIQSAERAIRRAHSAARHAVRQLESAPSPRAHARHERRLRNAQRAEAEARRLFGMMALTDA